MSAALENNARLEAELLPPGTFALFLASRGQDFTPIVPNSVGALCLGGDIGRFQSQVAQSTAGGRATLALDLTALPLSSSTSPALPGQIWRFQCWYRDGGTSPASNFTSAVAVRFD